VIVAMKSFHDFIQRASGAFVAETRKTFGRLVLDGTEAGLAEMGEFRRGHHCIEVAFWGSYGYFMFRSIKEESDPEEIGAEFTDTVP
jgi:hypothetical protein